MGNNWDVRKASALKALAVFALVMVFAGCGIPRGTKNVGLGIAFYDKIILQYIQVPYGLKGGETAQWEVEWYGGTGPYEVTWDFGGGGENPPSSTVSTSGIIDPNDQSHNISTRPNYKYSRVNVLMTQPLHSYNGPFDLSVSVTDANGITGSTTTTYSVDPADNGVPSILAMDASEAKLVVTVSDADGDPVTVTVAGYTGMTAGSTSELADGAGVATFNFTADDIIAGASTTVEVTATDWNGGSTTATSPIIWVNGLLASPDTLYAIPMSATAAVDEPVTVLVYTGATGGFQFMLNVGLRVPADASYVSNTFNVGAMGGDTDDADGVWNNISTDGGFILEPDALIMPGANPDATLGTDLRYDFNISPLMGTDQASVSGALFSAQFSFSAAGTKTITFQEFNGVNRTYYSDLATQTDTFWGNYVDGTIDVY